MMLTALAAWNFSCPASNRAYSPSFQTTTNANDRELSWKLEITVQQCHRSISRAIQAFVQAIKILEPSDCEIHTGAAELMFDVESAPIRPKSFYQKTCWQYRLKRDPNYVLEVSRLDSYDHLSVIDRHLGTNTKFPDIARRPTKTEWDACILHAEWDECLGQNLTLKTGQCAEWDPSLNSFFPANNASAPGKQIPGFERFLLLVHEVIKRLGHVKM